MERNNDVKHYFAKQCNMACLEQYLPLAKKVEYAKGENIFQKHPAQRYLVYLRKGEVERTFISAGGNEKILKVVGAKSIVGETIFFQQFSHPDDFSNNDSYYFRARKKCEAYLFSSPVVYDTLLKDELVVRCLLNWFCSRMNSLSAQIADSMVRDTHYRVCNFLYNYAYDFGQPNDQGQYVYQGKLSHYDIAKYLGINRVSVTKVLKALHDSGIIIKERHRLVILDMDYFKKM